MASVGEMRMNSGVKGGHVGENQLILACGDMKEGKSPIYQEMMAHLKEIRKLKRVALPENNKCNV